MNKGLFSKISWNLSGVIVPFFSAFIAIPILLQNTGKDAFGLLTLAWAIVGYLGILDMGLGKSLTRGLSEYSDFRQHEESWLLIQKISRYITWFGIFWVVVLLLFAPQISRSFSENSNISSTTIFWSIAVVSLAIPFVMKSTSRIAILEAELKFKEINLVKISSGSAMFILPMLVSIFTANIIVIMSSLVFVRVISYHFYNQFCNILPPKASSEISIHKHLFFGGWLTVSNMISPLMQYFDRFFIASKLSLSQVTLYTIPFDMLVRMTSFPSAFMAVVFPLMVRTKSANQSHELLKLLWLSFAVTIFLWLPFLIVLYFIGQEFLILWLGKDYFDYEMLKVWNLLLIGIFVNGVAYVHMTHLHSLGHSKITAMAHMAELPVYLLLLFWLGVEYGISGVATAWVIRTTLDFLILTVMSSIYFQESIVINVLYLLLVGVFTGVILWGEGFV